MTNFLDREEIDNAFRGVQPVEDFQVGSHQFPYTRLTPTGFELLQYALHQSAQETSGALPYDCVRILNEGADRGRDLILYKQGAPIGIVQCKRYQSAICVPEVFREIIRFILFAQLDSALLPEPDGFLYKLVLATPPAETVSNLFAEPARVIAEHSQYLPAYIEEVIDNYASFKSIKTADVRSVIEKTLSLFRYELVLPVDLDALVDASPGVQQRFFGSRLVVDSSIVEAGLADQRAKLDELLRRTPEPITDTDLGILRDRITNIPESHRFSAGFAKFFGYPMEMFKRADNLKAFMPRVAGLKGEIDLFFINWLNGEAQRMAEEICRSVPVTVTVHPFARQIPSPFLGTVAANVISHSEFGRVAATIVHKAGGRVTTESDDEIFARLLRHFQDRGVELLRGNFSKYENPPELFEQKKALMSFAIRGINNDQELERYLRRGLDVMKEELLKAAAQIRSLGQQKRTIVLQSLDFLDLPDELARLAKSS